MKLQSRKAFGTSEIKVIIKKKVKLKNPCDKLDVPDYGVADGYENVLAVYVL